MLGLYLRIIAVIGGFYGALPFIISLIPIFGAGDISANPLSGWPQIVDHFYEIRGKRQFVGPQTNARVLIASFENDEQGRYQRFVADQIARLGEANLGSEAISIMETSKLLGIKGRQRNEGIRKAEKIGREWLERRGGHVLIWGSVSTSEGGAIRFLPPTPALEVTLTDLPQVVYLPQLTGDDEVIRVPIIQSLTAIFTAQKPESLEQAQIQYYNLEHMTKMLRSAIENPEGSNLDQPLRTLRSAHFRLIHFVPTYWPKEVIKFENQQLAKNCCSYLSLLHRGHAKFHNSEPGDAVSLLTSAIADYDRAFERMPVEISPAERAFWLFSLGDALRVLGESTNVPEHFERASLEFEKSATYYLSTDYLVSFINATLVAGTISGWAGKAHADADETGKARRAFERAFNLYVTGLQREEDYRNKCACDQAYLTFATAFLSASDVAIRLITSVPSQAFPSAIHKRKGRDFAGRAESLITIVINKIDAFKAPLEWGEHTMLRARAVFNKGVLQDKAVDAKKYFLESAVLAGEAAEAYVRAGRQDLATSAKSWQSLAENYANMVGPLASKSENPQASESFTSAIDVGYAIEASAVFNLNASHLLSSLILAEADTPEKIVEKSLMELNAYRSQSKVSIDERVVLELRR